MQGLGLSWLPQHLSGCKRGVLGCGGDPGRAVLILAVWALGGGAPIRPHSECAISMTSSIKSILMSRLLCPRTHRGHHAPRGAGPRPLRSQSARSWVTRRGRQALPRPSGPWLDLLTRLPPPGAGRPQDRKAECRQRSDGPALRPVSRSEKAPGLTTRRSPRPNAAAGKPGTWQAERGTGPRWLGATSSGGAASRRSLGLRGGSSALR